MKLPQKQRREQILASALDSAESLGLQKITYSTVGDAAEIHRTSVHFYFPTMSDLREAIVERAITEKRHAIVAQALTDPLIDSLVIPEEAKAEALAWAAGVDNGNN